MIPWGNEKCDNAGNEPVRAAPPPPAPAPEPVPPPEPTEIHHISFKKCDCDKAAVVPLVPPVMMDQVSAPTVDIDTDFEPEPVRESAPPPTPPPKPEPTPPPPPPPTFKPAAVEAASSAMDMKPEGPVRATLPEPPVDEPVRATAPPPVPPPVRAADIEDTDNQKAGFPWWLLPLILLALCCCIGLLAALLCWARGKKDHDVTYVTKEPVRSAPPPPNKEFVINKFEDEANVEAEIERKLQTVSAIQSGEINGDAFSISGSDKVKPTVSSSGRHLIAPDDKSTAIWDSITEPATSHYKKMSGDDANKVKNA